MAKNFLQFKAQAAGRNPELLVYGEIDEWWGEVRSRDFAEMLQAIDAPEIDVRINSDGGSVFVAQAIYSSLKRHPAKINVYIDGIAASAATIIAMAGDVIYMPENAMMMVHQPLTGVYGNADDMREVADLLDKVRDTMIPVYRDKSGLSDDKIIELLSTDNYLTAAECKELGLVDEIISALKIAASRVHGGGSYEVNGLTIEAERYKRLPEEWRNAVESTINQPAGTGNTKQKEVTSMTLDELKAQHPDVFRAAVEEGQQLERERIQAIEDMSIKGHEALAAKAKFETGVSAEAFAVELIKAEKATKEKFLANRATDAEGVDDVENQSDPDNHTDAKAERGTVVNTIAQAFTARNNRKI